MPEAAPAPIINHLSRRYAAYLGFRDLNEDGRILELEFALKGDKRQRDEQADKLTRRLNKDSRFTVDSIFHPDPSRLSENWLSVDRLYVVILVHPTE